MAKNMNLSFNTQDLQVLLKAMFAKVSSRSTFLAWMIVAGVLIYAFVVMSSILSINDDQAYRDTQLQTRISSQFDKNTIEKVDNLKQSNDPSAIELPAGRRNPFAN